MTGELTVRGLTIEVASGANIVDSVDLHVPAGAVLGIVGESGSGKSTVGLGLLGFAKPGARIAAGSVQIGGVEMIGVSDQELRSRRGTLVSYVPQDPATALNPSMRVGEQVAELVRYHTSLGERARLASVIDTLRRVQLPTDVAFLRRYPHQLSGGQQQRLAIGIALSCSPDLVVLDEPTTGLDVVTQAHILDEVRRLGAETGVTFVYISHDLAAVAAVAAVVAVMYAGEIVEEAAIDVLVTQPRHPYTRGLVASVPDHVTALALKGIPGVAVGVGGRRITGCQFRDRCVQRIGRCDDHKPLLEPVGSDAWVRCHAFENTPRVEVHEREINAERRNGAASLLVVEDLRAEHRSPRGPCVVAAADVSFEIASGECVALVGESGSGKSTIARCIAGLHPPVGGSITLGGERLEGIARKRSKQQRRALQLIFQNPYDSLNPRHTIESSLVWSAKQLRGVPAEEARREVAELLNTVQLPARTGALYPAELSGGERQRAVIARALAAHPDLLVCDEVTSALDVSVQAAVIELLLGLQRDLDLTILFITHDLGVVASIADRVLVLERGVVLEQGPVTQVLNHPVDVYTQRLIAAAPRLNDRPIAPAPRVVNETLHGV